MITGQTPWVSGGAVFVSDRFRNLSAKPLTRLQCRYKYSFVSQKFVPDYLCAVFCALAFRWFFFVTSSAFRHSVIYSADSLFLHSCSRGLGPLLQSISLSNATFRSWITCPCFKSNAFSQLISHCGHVVWIALSVNPKRHVDTLYILADVWYADR